MKIVPIVEGHGDVQAVPVLLRRLAKTSPTLIEIVKPIRIPRGKLVKAEELRRGVMMAAMRAEVGDAIFVILDADDDCPATLAPAMLQMVDSERRDRKLSLVVAKREFEAWFIAAAVSLSFAGKLNAGTVPPSDPEGVRDAKNWLGQRMRRRYSETIDQPAFAAMFDLEAARQCSSFDKLVREFRKISSTT